MKYTPIDIPEPKKVKKRILESGVESRLCREVRKQRGRAYKFSSPNYRSVPDRICVFPDGDIWFVECKAPGQKPTPQQEKKMRELRELGAKVIWVASYGDVDFFIQNRAPIDSLIENKEPIDMFDFT